MRGSGTILLVTHAYPPRVTQGSTRPAGLAKYLRRIGYRVIVLTSGAAVAERSTDPDLIQTFDLMGTRVNWRRRNIAAHEGRSGDRYSEKASALSGFLAPDPQAFAWAPFARTAAARLARRERIDCVISTSIPQSAHLVGAAVARRGVPWIADLRDGWRFETMREWSARPVDRLDAALERMTLGRADHIVTVSEPVTRDVASRLGRPATTITNGFDPEADVDDRAAQLLDPGRHSFVYTGRFAAGSRSPEPLLAGLRLLCERSPADAERIEVVVAGPLTSREADLIDAPSPTRVRRLGVLDRAQALGLQAAADTLLVVTPGLRRGETPGKLFEYLAAGRPILVLGAGTEAARIVGELGAGSAADASDPERIAEALALALRGGLPRADREAVETFSQERMAERMATVVESVRAGRSTPRARDDLDEGAVPSAGAEQGPDPGAE